MYLQHLVSRQRKHCVEVNTFWPMKKEYKYLFLIPNFHTSIVTGDMKSTHSLCASWRKIAGVKAEVA